MWQKEDDLLFEYIIKDFYHGFFIKPIDIDHTLLAKVHAYSKESLPTIIDELYCNNFSPSQYNHPCFYTSLKECFYKLRKSKYMIVINLAFFALMWTVLGPEFVRACQIVPEDFLEAVAKYCGVLILPFLLVILTMFTVSQIWSQTRPESSEIEFVRNALDYRLSTKFGNARSGLHAISNDYFANKSINELIRTSIKDYYLKYVAQR